MLESITLTFQAHEDVTFDLSQSITTFTGATDQGKSSILRAIRWLALNRPEGDSFIPWGKDYAEVALTVDGRTITRKKGKAANQYTLDGKEFNALGRGNVPEEIANLLSLTEANFARQLDPPFWFSLTAGEVSRELNGIINLDAIDDTLANIASELRKAKATASVSQERLDKARQDRESLDWTVLAGESLASVESAESEMAEIRLKRSRLDSTVQEGKATLEVIQTCQQAKIAGLQVVGIGDGLAELAGNRSKLESLLSQIAQTTEVIKHGSIPRDAIAGLDGLQEEFAVCHSNRNTLESLIGQLNKARQSWQQASTLSQDAQDQLTKEVGKTCPICQRPLPQSSPS